MESIGHTHTHSGRNFHYYGTTVVLLPHFVTTSLLLMQFSAMADIPTPHMAVMYPFLRSR